MVRVYGNNDDGGHAPFLKVPANTLVQLPDALSFATGAAISCGTGTAYWALRRLHVTARDTVAIFGPGAGRSFGHAIRGFHERTRYRVRHQCGTVGPCRRVWRRCCLSIPPRKTPSNACARLPVV